MATYFKYHKNYLHYHKNYQNIKTQITQAKNYKNPKQYHPVSVSLVGVLLSFSLSPKSLFLVFLAQNSVSDRKTITIFRT
jgi:hypothetical protein